MAYYIESTPMYFDQTLAGQLSYQDYRQKLAMTQDITSAK